MKKSIAAKQQVTSLMRYLKHKKKLFFCRKFRNNLRLSERRDAAQQLGACKRFLEVHEGGPLQKLHLPVWEDQHHYFLCPVSTHKPQRRKEKTRSPGKTAGRRCNEIQQAFLSRLPSVLAQQCVDAFCNYCQLWTKNQDSSI